MYQNVMVTGRMNIDKREDTQDDIGKLRARESIEV